MAWRVHFPTQLLLLLLFPGTLSDRKIFRKVAGETLTVRCNYPSLGSSYKEQGLCREVAGFVCAKLTPSASTQGRVPRLSIWDKPSAGFFAVSLADLREKDSGHYWCSMRHTSTSEVFHSVKFSLAVSPAPTQASRNVHRPPSETRNSVPPTEGASKALGALSASTVPPRPQNATPCPGPVVSCALVPGLCGLLISKTLALLALLWALRSRCVQHTGVRGRPAPAQAPRAPKPRALKQTSCVPQTWAPRSCSLTSELCSPAKTRPEPRGTLQPDPEGAPGDPPPSRASLHRGLYRLLMEAKPA